LGASFTWGGLQVQGAMATLDLNGKVQLLGEAGLNASGTLDHVTHLKLTGGHLVTPFATISGPARSTTAMETTLELQASFESTGNVYIGAQINEVGHVVADGHATSKGLYVGYAGSGTLAGGWATER